MAALRLHSDSRRRGPGRPDFNESSWVRSVGTVVAALFFCLITIGAGVQAAAASAPGWSAATLSGIGNERFSHRSGISRDGLIQLAQDKKESRKREVRERKPASTSKKTTPPPKKRAAPKKSTSTKKKAPARKKTTPVKKKTAPAKKQKLPAKKKKAPATKKTTPAPKNTTPTKTRPLPKKTTPAPKEKQPAPKKGPPAERAPTPKPGGTSEQQEQNQDFCAQNPSSPSCNKDQAQQQKEQNDAYCADNPQSPLCGGKPQRPAPDTEKPGPVVNAPAEDVKVPSFCEQNPQMPQCQQRPEETPEDPVVDEDERPPLPPGPDGGTDQPTVPPSQPPAPPPSPSPPPQDTGDSEQPAGPTIQTVEQCPDGQIQFLGVCRYPSNCPEGQVQYLDEAEGQVSCQASCPGDLIELAGVGTCVGGGYCSSIGGMNYGGQCLEQCPAGAEQIGQSCQIVCPEGQVSQGNQCVSTCPQGSTWQDGACRVADCPDGQERVGDVCLDSCAAGEVREGSQCVAVQCSVDELVVDGICTPALEAPYENLVEACVENLSSGGGFPVQDELQGATAEETCENLIDAICEAGIEDDTAGAQYAACGERPCDEGQQNIGGQCMCPEGQFEREDGACGQICPAGQVSLADGSCGAQCATGTFLNQAGQCVVECPGGVALNGQCFANRACPAGYVPKPSGECVPTSCTPDQVTNADGTCSSPCPEGQQPSFQNPAICRAVAECGEGGIPADGYEGCRNECGREGYNGADSYVVYEGFCTRRTEVPYEDVLENCLDGRGYGSQLESVSQDACEAAIVEHCTELDNGRNTMARYCGDIYQPAEDEFVAPPTEEPLCATGQAVYGGTCVDDTMIEEICSGGVLIGGQCSASCPAGTEQVGNRCEGTPQPPEDEQAPVEDPVECPPGQAGYEGACIDDAMVEEICGGGVLSNGQCETACPAGMVQQGNRCETPPPEEPPVVVQDPPGDGQDAPPKEEQPPADGSQAPADENQATDEDSQPPADEIQTPDEENQPPADENQAPDEENQSPADENQAPDDDSQSPADGNQESDEENQPPADENQAPDDDNQPPADENQAPDEENQSPADENQAPDDDNQPPADENQAPDDDSQSPADENQAPDDDNQPPADENQAPDDDSQPPADENQAPDEEQPSPPPSEGTPQPPTEQRPTEPEPGQTSPKERNPAPGKPDISATQERKSTDKPGAETMPLAIVISNDRYRAKGIPQKPHAHEGAESFVRYLTDEAGLDRSRIIRFSNPGKTDMDALFGTDVSSDGHLKVALDHLPSSELIFYYSGHALPVDGGRDALLLPSDVTPAKAAETSFRLSTLYRNLQKLRIRHLRIYLDAGFNQNIAAEPLAIAPPVSPVRVGPPKTIFGTANPRWVIFSAGTGDQPVLFQQGERVSIFNRYLLEGLRGAADRAGNSDRTVTAGELGAYLQKEVPQAVEALTGGVQTPSFTGGLGEILVTLETELDPAADQSAAPTAAPEVSPEKPADASPPLPTPKPQRSPSDSAEPATSEPEAETEEPKAEAPAKPSFDCRKARSRDEKAICANPEIARLDSQMAKLYSKRRRSLRGAAGRKLTQSQRAWLGKRRACGSNVSCLRSVFQERIRQLR